MGKTLIIILIAFSLTGCAWWSLVSPSLELADGIEELSQPAEKTEKKETQHYILVPINGGVTEGI
jgi:hypothetical protein